MDTTTPQLATAEATDDRATAKAIIDKLPASTTLEQIQYHVGVAALLREREGSYERAMSLGVEEATRQGLLLTSEQIEQEILSWRR
jgi:hypothetical protein